MGLAQECVQALEGHLFQQFRDVSLDGPLGVEVALLGKFNGRLDIRCDPLQYEQGLGIGSLIEIVQADEVPDLSVAQALAELVLKGLERVEGVFL
jgi:hypothetical protein